jgi:hypothetical protein
MELRRVRCSVRPGLFKSEYVVSFPAILPRGQGTQNVEFVADRHGVILSEPMAENGGARGEFEVWYVDRSNGGVKILVPASGGSDDAYVTVPEEVLTD